MSTALHTTFEGIIEHNSKEANLYYNHVKVPAAIVDAYKSEDVKRILFCLNGQQSNHGAFIPLGDGTYFIITSKQLLKTHGLEIGSKVTVTIEPDTSRYGMPVCDEMKELLLQDEEGSKLLHQLTDGKIRSLLFHANKFKSSDKRLEKSVIILEHLKANNGKLDWKMLNEAFKQGLG